jgi:hypothetical protein
MGNTLKSCLPIHDASEAEAGIAGPISLIEWRGLSHNSFRVVVALYDCKQERQGGLWSLDAFLIDVVASFLSYQKQPRVLKAISVLESNSPVNDQWNFKRGGANGDLVFDDAVVDLVGCDEFAAIITSLEVRPSLIRGLDFSGHGIESEIPAELGRCDKLMKLDFGYNKLIGAIPCTFGNMTALTSIKLTSNMLTGSIPAEFGHLHHLKSLWLNKNQLSGAIPITIGKLTSLEHLCLDHNKLTGDIPKELGNLTNLTNLNLHGNHHSGMGYYFPLTRLFPNQSSRTTAGPIPAELGGLKRLQQLHLSKNLLTGHT